MNAMAKRLYFRMRSYGIRAVDAYYLALYASRQVRT
jgi:hypothetical protein